MNTQQRLLFGKELIAQRRFDEARKVFIELCARTQSDAECWFTLGVINGMLRCVPEAISCCRKAIELAPRHVGAWYNLGVGLREAGRFTEAVEAFRNVLRIEPGHADAAAGLAYLLVSMNQQMEGEAVIRRVLSQAPGNAQLHAVHGSILQIANNCEAAIAAYTRAIELNHPQHAALHENLAVALCRQGHHDESIRYFETALATEPHSLTCYSNMLLTLQYLPVRDPVAMLDRHRRWPGNTLPAAKSSTYTHRGVSDGGRLRIGYVSSDFRRHSVAHFIEPLLRNHDAGRYEITCYYAHGAADATTHRLRGLAHRWRDVAGLDDETLRKSIVADGIDILVDLNGHTQGNRLPVFAQRSAPVQVSCIGYPDTTGVREMDYRITDAIADPAGAEQWCTEKLIRVPGCFLCYQPPAVAPPVAPPPFARNGFVTFGSFNNLAKINPVAVQVWARLLRELPGSRLVIKNPSLTEAATRMRCRAQFNAEGIPDERLELIGFIANESAHLSAYERVDIALDTFPYNGATTTCEALWMGVPVVSLCGACHGGRVGASLLTAAGFQEWIASTVDEYVHIASTLAEDSAALEELRAQLRARVMQSRLCAGKDYAREMEALYERCITR